MAILGLLFILVGGIAFTSNSDFKSRHYMDFSSKQATNFTIWQFVFASLFVIGIIMIISSIASLLS